jgi:hypothetical protein
VPDVIAEEIKLRGPTDVTERALEQTSWLLIREAAEVPQSSRLGDSVTASHRFSPGRVRAFDREVVAKLAQLQGHRALATAPA